MALETKLSLSQETLGEMQDLVQVNIDSYNGFLEAAEKIEDEKIAQLFRQYASQRSAQAAELKGLLGANGEQPAEKGSMAAAVHRAWIDVKAAVTGGGVHAVLAEAERGEDHIKHMYEDTIKKTSGSAVNDVLHRQYKDVKSAHDQVRDLRDAHADAKK